MSNIQQPRIRSRWRLPAGALAIALLASACGSDAPATTNAAAASSTSAAAGQTGASTAGGTINIALDGAVNCLDPQQTDTPAELNIYRQEVETLTRIDPASGELQPYLAESWKPNADATSFEFTLKKGVTFSDGTAWDAEAFKKNFDAAVALGAEAVRAASYLAEYNGVVVNSPESATISFKKPNASFLNHTASIFLAILAPASLAKTPAERCADGVLGTGPFVQESYTPNQSVILTKRADYNWAPEWAGHTGAAISDKLVFSLVPESGSRTGLLTSGQADIVQSLDAAAVPDVTAAGGTTQNIITPGIPSRMQINVQNPILADELVRQAIRLAVNREEVSTTIYDGLVKPADGVLTVNVPGHVALPDLLKFDAAQAGALLDQAGWVLGEDGTRSKDGQPLAFNITKASPYSATLSILELIQQQLAAVGINATIKDSTPAEFADIVKNHTYDVLYSNTTDIDGDVLRAQVSPALGNRNNLPADDPIAAELAKQNETGDIAERNKLLATLQEEIVETAYQIPVIPLVQIYGLGGSVKGVQYDIESRLYLYGASKG